MEEWVIVSASRCGTSHIRRGERRQDAFTAFRADLAREWLVAIASDGAGSAKMGGQGAALICRTLGREAREHLRSGRGLPSDEDVWNWVDAARDRIFAAAERRQLTPRDFAATLVLVISNGPETIAAHIGDGAIVARSDGGIWEAISWPDGGEYAGTTFFATDDPEPRMRVARPEGLYSSFALFTDGLERLILDLANKTPHGPFFERMTAPLRDARGWGAERILSKKLGEYLEGEAINARTDDDKTLILAVRVPRE
jgi:hypothetical protein